MGPASWVMPGSMGQEAFDSLARPLETGVRNCELAVKPDDTAWTGVPSKASGETANNSVKRVRVSPCAGPESEEMRAQNRRNGAPQGAHYQFRTRLSAPRPLS